MSIKRALISVSDKTGLIEFAKKLISCGVEIISTGGTALALQAENIAVTRVSDITQFPEIMSGRVKTLHPKIHGGILGKRDAHATEAQQNNIHWIDYVIVNLYPFSKTVDSGAAFSDCIEQIDIGGPAMIRAAAKNMEWVTVVVDPADYISVADAIKNNTLDFNFRKKLSAKAFALTAQYDAMIAHYFSTEAMPHKMTLPLEKVMDCRYGENPHQQAAVYRNLLDKQIGLLNATLLQGKALSFNNFNDTAAALNTVLHYKQPACVIVKHANPCGVAIASDIDVAFKNAWEADSVSAFGGVIVLNKMCTQTIAAFLTSVFIEVILAPEFSAEALTLFSKKPNLRVMQLSPWPSQFSCFTFKYISGGLLWQTVDDSVLDEKNCRVVTKRKPTELELQAMRFSWPVLKQLKSNAILISDHEKTIGVGMGQVSRVDAVKCAIEKAKNKMQSAVLASDAFFPFADSIALIAQTPIRAIVQPGGSIKDEMVIAACDAHDIAMVLTGVRCFNH